MSVNAARRGPNTPRCNHTDDEPGPPLNENVMGRVLGVDAEPGVDTEPGSVSTPVPTPSAVSMSRV
ncbi:MAG: hypothetical protein HDKAJFGB_02109 [Anaerolineae bacterium]|nr:hypothetical protein [Anaerolineae bacterium]